MLEVIQEGELEALSNGTALNLIYLNTHHFTGIHQR